MRILRKCIALDNAFFLKRKDPFKMKELAYPYQKDEPIANFRGVEWYFNLPLNFNITFCKQIAKILKRYHIIWCMIRVSTVCLYPIKWRLIIQFLCYISVLYITSVPQSLWLSCDLSAIKQVDNHRERLQKSHQCFTKVAPRSPIKISEASLLSMHKWLASTDFHGWLVAKVF